jgi:hypothetical protein
LSLVLNSCNINLSRWALHHMAQSFNILLEEEGYVIACDAPIELGLLGGGNTMPHCVYSFRKSFVARQCASLIIMLPLSSVILAMVVTSGNK